MTKLKKRFLLAGAVMALEAFTVSAPAFAQQIDEIVVTARKRQESLQDVPLAVSAFDQATLEKTFIPTIDGLGDYIPNVAFGATDFGAKALTATIRGVGFSDLDKTFEPAVGFAVDGVFLASNGGAAIDVFDIEQVEVLRGPQGTLYGRNTVGGVISVTRSKPTEEAGVRATARLGNHSRREYLAVANTGRMGDIALKGYAFKKDTKTFATNLATGEKDDEVDNLSYGAAVSYTPSDNFDALISVDIFDDDSGVAPKYNFTDTSGLICLLTVLPTSVSGLPLAPSAAGSGCTGASFDLAEDSGFEVFNRGRPSISHTDGYSITSNINWDINDNLTLTSVTGWRDADESLNLDNLATPLAETIIPGVSVSIFEAAIEQTQDQFTQEFRLSGSLQDNLDFVAGVYYLNSSFEGTAGDLTDPFGNTRATRTQVFGGFGPDLNRFDIGQDLTTYAIFADGTYKFTDSLSLSGGLRFTHEKKDLSINYIESSEPGVSGTSGNPVAKFDSLTGRAILQYDISDNVMAFGGWSRGFRSGGFNGRAVSLSAIGPYDPETVDNFEGGLRMELFDNRFRLNPTVFVTKYKDKQEEISSSNAAGDAIETIVENASSVDIWGIEVDWQAQLNEYFSMRGSAGYLSAEYDEFLVVPDPVGNPGVTVDVSEDRLVRRAPELSASWGAAFNYPVTDNIDFVSTLDYIYSDDFFTGLQPDTSGRGRHIIKSDEAINITAGFESTNEDGFNWSLTGYARDITDPDAGRVTATLDVAVFYFGAGRPTKLYGVELGVEF